MDYKLLIIEDDLSIFQVIKERFQQWAIEVIGIDDFKNVIDIFDEEQPHLVIIDIQLPAYDGFHWCREIRRHHTVPIIFLSSRDHPMDMVMAMQMGADDFIQKPFNMDVLVAKVQAILRRSYAYKDEGKSLMTVWNGLTIDYARSMIYDEDNQQELTKNEQYILRILLEQVNHIVSREELMNRLWDDERFVNDNTLSVNVNRLRTKMECFGLSDCIQTKKGLGYMAVTKE
ncbi:response regulator transcription factor [Kurthia sibirica]|uniref:DNA-binding response regulator n=1 Tax=Kurthia sibirica TaxID=202750 RepID=A0A2U3AM68_9BACL|nr:response regulator transcription factor [Kurthia sibirica]PWI25629.1 DNA-binding response regulator [Kurthia sibirica]GEK34071.1 sensory transduction protein BceR [Kurthia sibirica]